MSIEIISTHLSLLGVDIAKLSFELAPEQKASTSIYTIFQDSSPVFKAIFNHRIGAFSIISKKQFIFDSNFQLSKTELIAHATFFENYIKATQQIVANIDGFILQTSDLDLDYCFLEKTTIGSLIVNVLYKDYKGFDLILRIEYSLKDGAFQCVFRNMSFNGNISMLSNDLAFNSMIKDKSHTFMRDYYKDDIAQVKSLYNFLLTEDDILTNLESYIKVVAMAEI